MNKRETILHNFVYHAPKPGQQEIYASLRDKGKELALLILDSTPESREQSIAITKLEEVIMWSNAGLARS